MKCEKCNNEIKIKNAKFCPFCGEPIAEKVELANYTRAQFFSVGGDDEFREAWEKVRSMSANEAILWLREHPPVHYVYRIFGEWKSNSISGFSSKCIRRYCVKAVCKNGKCYPKKYKCTVGDLYYIGNEVFLTEEECKEAILEEVNSEHEN